MTGDEILPAPLTRPDAQKLDTRLRRTAQTARRNIATLAELVDQAREGRIAETLNFTSWTAYLADALGGTLAIESVADRQQVVSFLAGEGMSQRAIASAAGVAKTTVHRDLETEAEVVLNGPPAEPREFITVSHDEAPPAVDLDRSNVVGLDGKTYRPRQRAKRDKPSTKVRPGERPGATTYSRKIQGISASIADNSESLTDEQVMEALGAAQFLYELLRGAKIIREGKISSPGRPAAAITVELVKAEDGYATADGRWLVGHDPGSSCAPQRWWWVTDTTQVFVSFALPTLDAVKQEIARLASNSDTR
jgi:hypothetical protein